jgi:hypothetical protein
MAKKNASKKPVEKAVKPAQNLLANRLDTLLHTIRCIAQHEDELNALLHAIRNADGVTPPVAAELRAVLDSLPAEEYAWELHAAEMQLDADRDRLEAAA